MSDEGIDKNRRRFLTAATTVVGGTGAALATVPFVSYLQPSARTKATGAPVEVDISKLKPGERGIFKWRGQPVWVVRRAEQSVQELKEMDDKVRDPNSEEPQQPAYAKNETRSRKPEYLVVVGLCTHLGCSPNYVPEGSSDAPESDWKGGFLCPCHGSRFDLAGRVFKGVPAPTNLPVPPYKFLSDTTLLIGADEENAG